MPPIECFLAGLGASHVDDDGEPRYDVVRLDNGAVVATDAMYLGHLMPVGAMWWTEMSDGTLRHRPTGPDDWTGIEPDAMNRAIAEGRKRQPSYLFDNGPHLHVQTPGGSWNIDSRASNCALPWDYEHRCWVRHGEPPKITVDKNGLTCAAGAGSIQCGTFHGFLRDGQLVE